MNQWWCCNKAWLHFKVLVSQSFCVFAAGFGLMLRLLYIYSYIYIYNIKMHSSLLIFFFLFFIFSYFLSFCGDIIVACKKTKKIAAAAVEKNLILPRHTLLTSIQSPAYHKKSKIKKLQIYTFVYLNVICGINIITCFPTYNKIPTIFYYLPRKFIILKKKNI